MQLISMPQKRPLKFHPMDLSRLREVCQTPGQLCQARSVYLALCEYRSYAGHNRNSTFVGIQTLVEVSGVSRAGVFRALKLLILAGVISRDKIDHSRTKTTFRADFYDREAPETHIVAKQMVADTQAAEIETLRRSDIEIERRNRRASEPASVRDTRRLRKYLQDLGIPADHIEVKTYRGYLARQVIVTAIGYVPQSTRAAIKHYFAGCGKQAIIDNAVRLLPETKTEHKQMETLQQALHHIGAEVYYRYGDRVWLYAPDSVAAAAAALVQAAGLKPVIYDYTKTGGNHARHAS